MPESILVTGGAGFIGSHVVEHLLASGSSVYVVDDLSAGSLDNLKQVRGHPELRLIVDTIMNWPMMNETVGKVDGVIHLAAAEGVVRALEESVETITTNVRGTEIVLDVCHNHGVKLFVASASEIYGKSDEVLDEDQDRLLGPITGRRWAYACTKALDEFLSLAFHREKALPVVVGRIFDTVGPRQTWESGKVVPTFVRQALEGHPITVHGSGTQRRSFLHVSDCVDAIVGLMEREDSVGEVFNIGHEAEITVRDLARRVKERTGSESQVRLVPREKVYGEGFVDVERRRPDTRKLQLLLDWEPVRGIDAIIDDVAEFQRESLC